jgi:GNAT superfamily N-acetyltransferase
VTALRVRPLATTDIGAAVDLHRAVLHMEFISRCGRAFVRRYYRAWLESPAAIALVAEDGSGGVAGVLLGATDPAVHTEAMVKGHGAALAVRMALAAAVRPRLAREVVATRVARYLRGLWRIASGGRRHSPATDAAPSTDASPAADPASPAADSAVPTGVAPTAGPASPADVAEVTHLLVDPAQRGQGVGRALVDAAANAARASGRGQMVLVTPPDMAARTFYERLGWVADGEVVSRSGEPFVRYRLSLT